MRQLIQEIQSRVEDLIEALGCAPGFWNVATPKGTVNLPGSAGYILHQVRAAVADADKAEAEKQALSDQLSGLNQRADSLWNENCDLKRNIDKLVQERDKLRTIVAALDGKESERNDVLIKQLDRQHALIGRQKQTIKVQFAEIETWRSLDVRIQCHELEQLRADNDRFKQAVIELEQKLKCQQDATKVVVAENSRLLQVIRDLEQKLTHVQGINKTVTEDNHQLCAELAAVQQSGGPQVALTLSLQLQQALEERDSWQARYADQSRLHDQMRAELAELRKQNTELRSELGRHVNHVPLRNCAEIRYRLTDLPPGASVTVFKDGSFTIHPA